MKWHYLRICSTNGENIVFFASRIKSSMNPAMALFLELFKGKLLYINDTSLFPVSEETQPWQYRVFCPSVMGNDK